MFDDSGTNFTDHLGDRFQVASSTDKQSGCSNGGGELSLTADGKNTRIAKDLGRYIDLVKHLEEFGITKLDSPNSEASRKIPISKGVLKAILPLMTIICGMNCYEDAERSLTFQELCGKAMLNAIILDSKFRKNLSEAVVAWNAGLKVGQELHDRINDLAR